MESGLYDGAPWSKPLRSTRQNRFLDLMMAGVSRKAAFEQVGTTDMLSYWRNKSPAFEDRYQWVMAHVEATGSPVGDFVAFRKTFFGYDTFWHHRLMAETILAAPEDSISLILAPPEAGKTSLLTDLICWLLGNDPNYRICVISEGQDLARKIVGHVAKRMTDDVMFSAYIDRFGPFKREPKSSHKAKERYERRQLWNADAISVDGSHNDQRDPSLEARGAGSRIYGSRYDLILVDDVCSTQNVNQSSNLLNYLRQDVLTRISEDPVTKRRGKTVVVGTRVDHGDIYELMMEADGFVDNSVLIPAMNDGFSYWPEKWPVESLERRRSKVGENVWARVYMQQPVSRLGATFSDDCIEAALDRNRTIGDCPTTERMAGVDPALGGWCAITDVCYDAAKLYVVDQEAQRSIARTEDIISMIRNHAQRYRWQRVRVEQNAFQKGLVYDERLEDLGKKLGFRVEAHKTGRNKQDPVMGVAALPAAFYSGEISIPWGDDNSRRVMAPFVEELRAWRPDVPTRLLKQDRLMSFWFTYYGWLDLRKTLNRNNDAVLWRPSWSGGSQRGLRAG